MTDDIDRLLDESLSEGFDEMRSSTPLPAPRYAPVASNRGAFRRRLRFGVPLVLGTNMLVGVSVVTIAAASVGAKTVVTGSPNPLVWNHQITQVSPSASPEGHGGGRSSGSDPTSDSRGGESPENQGNRGSGSNDTPRQPSSGSGGDGGQNRDGDDSPSPTQGSTGGDDGGSSPTPSDGSDGGGSGRGN
jgi:hypothetical protein